MNKIKVSIIVPVWGVEKYIKKCLDSLVKQTLKEIEIIVVNDGSPDNSQKIIDNYVKKYPSKVRSFIKENGGQGSARNYGLEKATGEYIGYVDSDDYIELDMYEKMYNKAKNEELDIVICGSYNIDGNEKKVELDKIIFDNMKTNSFFGRMAVWNKIYKRKLLIDNNIQFRSRVWYEDVDFTLTSIINSKKVGYVNEPFYNYIIREGSTMNNSDIDRNLEIILAFEELKKDKKNNNYHSIIEFLATSHIYIYAIVRVINASADKEKKLEVINKLKGYIEKNFKNFKENEYLKLLSRNEKIIYYLIRLKQYNIIKLIFKIKRR